ncbi:hypothetical protein Ancab_016392, partial [Ancistrocladus abbreviatus]
GTCLQSIPRSESIQIDIMYRKTMKRYKLSLENGVRKRGRERQARVKKTESVHKSYMERAGDHGGRRLKTMSK